MSGKVTADSWSAASQGRLLVNRGGATRLKGNSRIDLELSMTYRISQVADLGRGPWKVSTTGWIYSVFMNGEPYCQYHWHPISDSHEKLPHMHVDKLDPNRHFPTGRILIEDVLRLAVDLGAEPVDSTKWSEVEARNREMFAKGATWGVGPELDPIIGGPEET